MFAEAASVIEGAQPYLLQKSCVRIGGVSLALTGVGCDEVRLSPELEAFQSLEETPDIKVQVDWVECVRHRSDKPFFDSGALWTLFRDGPDFTFDFTSPAFGASPYKRLSAAPDFRSAQLLLSHQALGNHHPVFPLEYPADELLITNYLSSGLGVEVHGCGLIDPETGGHLFLGHSGAGKSTTTMLWKSLRNPQILSDDRIILRLHDGELWMYGTPWHGEAAFAMAGKAKINRIFVIEHGDRNEVIPLTRAQAVGELFARCFPPFHSAPALERTIAFLDQILGLVPCYQYRFVPNVAAVNTVVGFHD